jgi:hypothetical protein
MIRDELGQKPNFWDGIRAHSIYMLWDHPLSSNL